MKHPLPETERRWKNQPLELEPDRPRMRWLWLRLSAIVVALLPAGAHLWQQNDYVDLEYALSELETQNKELTELERRLALDRSRLESLAVVEKWAARNDALERPEQAEITVLRIYEPEAEDLLARKGQLP